MTDPTPRRRAPGMTPEERRAMIVAAALPLVAEHGTAVSTAQVARAAGIGEATIFRAFGDKDALLDACVVAALRPDAALDGLTAVDLDQPLADRLAEAAGALEAYLARMGTVIGVLHATGRRAERASPDHEPRSDRRAEFATATVEALTALFEPDADALRLPPEQLAAAFMGLVLSRSRPVGGPPLDLAATVDLFLHGALTGAAA